MRSKIGWGNPKHNYTLGGQRIESSPEKDWEVLVDKNLNMTHHYALAAQIANHILMTKQILYRALCVIISMPPWPSLQHHFQFGYRFSSGANAPVGTVAAVGQQRLTRRGDGKWLMARGRKWQQWQMASTQFIHHFCHTTELLGLFRPTLEHYWIL